MMKNVLVTGASGNVGLEVLKALTILKCPLEINAGVRDPEGYDPKLAPFKLNKVKFDFTDPSSFNQALKNMDILFLLRPPNISDVEKYFRPLIAIARDLGTKHIIFLSVQGVENSKIIPHHKIEKLITDSRISYTFLRPAYFMQNFTTTLRSDLVSKKLIFLPAGNARFTLVDVKDVGAVAAKIICDVTQYMNKAYELTSDEKLNFSEMAETLSSGLGTSITYTSPSLLKFFITKKREGISTMLILVMIMLHYFPRFQKEPKISKWIENITGTEPTTFNQFISENKENLLS